MKCAVAFFLLAFILLFWAFGCEFLTTEKYSITVVNDFECAGCAFNVYLDGDFQFRIAERKSRAIQDVPVGKHLIECGDKVLGYELIQSWGEVYIQGDVEWSILDNFSLGEWYSLKK